MPTPRIILFGGTTEQVNNIYDWSADQFDIRHLPANYKLTSADIKYKPGLIIIIHDQPRQNGLSRLKKLKKKYSGIPIILLANNPSQEDILSGFRLGAVDVLLLPVKPDEFSSAIGFHYQKGKKASLGKRIYDHLISWFGSIREQHLAAAQKPSFKTLGVKAAGMMLNPTVESPDTHCDIYASLFGYLEVKVRGKMLPKIAGKKVNSLLAYILHHHRKPVLRDILMEKFWGDTSPASARNSLNVAIHTIRKHFAKLLPGQDFLIYHNERYSVNPELDIITDAEQFHSYWQKGIITEKSQGLEYALGAYNKAVALYRGDFLEEFLYDEWCESERENLKETYLLILDRQSTYFYDQRAYSIAISICKKMLQKDECLEDVHRRLIVSYMQLGQGDRAIRQYHKCEMSLQEELGVELTPQTKQLYQKICTKELV